MLVLTRRPGEELVINSNIVVRIVDVRGNKIRLGIAAPPDVLVDRREVFDRRERPQGDQVSVAGLSGASQGPADSE